MCDTDFGVMRHRILVEAKITLFFSNISCFGIINERTVYIHEGIWSIFNLLMSFKASLYFYASFNRIKWRICFSSGFKLSLWNFLSNCFVSWTHNCTILCVLFRRTSYGNEKKRRKSKKYSAVLSVALRSSKLWKATRRVSPAKRILAMHRMRWPPV